MTMKKATSTTRARLRKSTDRDHTAVAHKRARRPDQEGGADGVTDSYYEVVYHDDGHDYLAWRGACFAVAQDRAESCCVPSGTTSTIFRVVCGKRKTVERVRVKHVWSRGVVVRVEVRHDQCKPPLYLDSCHECCCFPCQPFDAHEPLPVSGESVRSPFRPFRPVVAGEEGVADRLEKVDDVDMPSHPTPTLADAAPARRCRSTGGRVGVSTAERKGT
jgi:hypothetical protein